MSNELVVTHHKALEILRDQDTPESTAILDYVEKVRKKDIAILGVDEAFVLQDSEGQIKAFKQALTLSVQAGTLIQPVYKGPFVVSAQGYEVWAERTGASVVFPKEVLVGGEWKPNPYAERDPENRRILAVHACAVAFCYSSMGIPQAQPWTTIFDTPSYRMIDLLAKAKQFPQAFKVLPKEMEPKIDKKTEETWANYPFDESMNLWIDTSHKEVITWLSQILNREKKAMDFAQTFAKRNALKHLSGIQKAPSDNWRFAVLAWRPTGNNIIKWDAKQYSDLQNRIAGMIGGSDEFSGEVDLKKPGSERVSDEDDFEAIEATLDPEDSPESEKRPVDQDTGQAKEKAEPVELSKDVKQAVQLSKMCPAEFAEACGVLNIDLSIPFEKYTDETAVHVCQAVSELVDNQN